MRSTLLYGELLTGRITGALDVTGCSWMQSLNDSGSVDQVNVPEAVVRRLGLRQSAAVARCFLAVEQGDRIREAGPIWTHRWNWSTGTLSLGAAGLWSYYDHRFILPFLSGARVQDVTTTISDTDLGGIARGLLLQARAYAGSALPIVHPAARVGTRTESFPGWKLQWVGDQLRELTQREAGAPDIRFRPRRKPSDRRFIEWVMEVGTEAAPQLSQGGADWFFDTTVPRGPVRGIDVDQDGTQMGSWAFVTGNGSENATLIARSYDPALPDVGYPLLDVKEARSSVERQDTLDAHAVALRNRVARPVEVWKMTVRADAVAEVNAGDYAQVVTKGDAYLPDGQRRMRIKSIAGDLGDDVTLSMFPLQAVLG